MQIEPECYAWQASPLTTTPTELCIWCIKVPYSSRINKKKAIQQAAGAAAIWYQKSDQYSRHYLNWNTSSVRQTRFPWYSCILLQFFFWNPEITILKVVGYENCVWENKLPPWGPGRKPQPANCWAILAIFWEKIEILKPFRSGLPKLGVAKQHSGVAESIPILQGSVKLGTLSDPWLWLKTCAIQQNVILTSAIDST